MSTRFGATASWAQTTTGTFQNVFRLVGGLAPSTSNMVLQSVTVGPFESNTIARSIRVAVYSGGSANNPLGATLVEDLGVVSISAGGYLMYTVNSVSSPTIPASQHLWIACKSSDPQNDTLRLQFRSDNTASGDLSSTAGRVNSASETNGTSETTAFPSTLAGTMSTGTAYYGWHLTYTVSGSSAKFRPYFITG